MEELASFPPGSLILDPMAGSGTVLRAAAEQGHEGLGFDLDPLAVLMAKVWTTHLNPEKLCDEARQVAVRAQDMGSEDVALPWMDEETSEFVEYWFGTRQRSDLRKLAHVLQEAEGPTGDALRIALSRTIITKDRGASLARDVSHSRPHRVRDDNDFEVFDEFLRSASRLARLMGGQQLPGAVQMYRGDARKLTEVNTAFADAVITSPPYLNAIDYMRGHRMSLVWLGYRIGDLRAIRSDSIGSERAPHPEADLTLAELLASSLGSLDSLPRNVRRMIDRYVLDLIGTISELHRVLRPGGKAILVIGNSTLRGVFVRNAKAVAAIAERVGFELVRETERELPPSRRYLPPPKGSGDSFFEKRMRTETVLTYARA
ncbi:MAG: hypothetical protein ACRDSJ_00150 [Rubrobacteraceae bacterium]